MFPSKIKHLASNVPLPSFAPEKGLDFQNLRILMMPIVFGDNATVPYKDCYAMLDIMCRVMPQHKDKVVYLTVDQKMVEPGKTHRRSGLHVDGYPHTEADKMYVGKSGIWAGNAHGGTWGGGGGWGGGNKSLYWHDGTGLLTVSSVEGCRAWKQTFDGEPKVEGDCEHLRDRCREENEVVLGANKLYWMSPGCVHESILMKEWTARTFVRVSLPSDCDWYEGCTPNPLGVKPAGRTASKRKFMGEGL